MQSDLRNLQAQQEIYYSNPANDYTYADDLALLTEVEPSQGVTITIEGADQEGWRAYATHAALADSEDKACGIFVGSGAEATATHGADTAGVVACTGE